MPGTMSRIASFPFLQSGMHRSDSFNVQVNGHGENATFSNFAFEPGEIVYIVQGGAGTRRTRESIEVGPDQHVEDPYALFINHSFSPNLKVRGRELVAIASISPGDELTFNYLASESAIAAPFVCHETGRAVNTEERSSQKNQ